MGGHELDKSGYYWDKSGYYCKSIKGENMNKYEKNKPVKQYEQMTLDNYIEDVKERVAETFIESISKESCPDCSAGTNALGKPLDCRTCNSTGSKP